MRETKVTCDRCGKVTKDFDVDPRLLSMVQAQPSVTVIVDIPLQGRWTYDLCPTCQNAVYELIRGRPLPGYKRDEA